MIWQNNVDLDIFRPFFLNAFDVSLLLLLMLRLVVAELRLDLRLVHLLRDEEDALVADVEERARVVCVRDAVDDTHLFHTQSERRQRGGDLLPREVDGLLAGHLRVVVQQRAQTEEVAPAHERVRDDGEVLEDVVRRVEEERAHNGVPTLCGAKWVSVKGVLGLGIKGWEQTKEIRDNTCRSKEYLIWEKIKW